jgi:ring-1,2-phenylacetyl-CoA epoxidase subunit PaaC
LSELSGDNPDELVFLRTADAYRNVQMVELSKGDWAFSMMRQYLFDALEMVRAGHLMSSLYRPLAEVASKIRPEELYHYRHTSNWIKRLGLGTKESNRRSQAALDVLWPAAAQLFVRTPENDVLIEAHYLPSALELERDWERLVVPFLETAGLRIPVGDPPVTASRDHHTPHLAELLADLQEVARLDLGAAW